MESLPHLMNKGRLKAAEIAFNGASEAYNVYNRQGAMP
jgi:hypothetical protein